MKLSFNEFNIWTGMTLEDFLVQKQDYPVESIINNGPDLKMIDGILCQKQCRNAINEPLHKRFLIRLYFKNHDGRYRLSHLRFLDTGIVTWNTIFPRAEDQDARYIGHLELMREWYGEPDILNENEFSYKLDGATIKCNRILDGKAKFTDGYVNYYFD